MAHINDRAVLIDLGECFFRKVTLASDSECSAHGGINTPNVHLDMAALRHLEHDHACEDERSAGFDGD